MELIKRAFFKLLKPFCFQQQKKSEESSVSGPNIEITKESYDPKLENIALIKNRKKPLAFARAGPHLTENELNISLQILNQSLDYLKEFSKY